MHRKNTGPGKQLSLTSDDLKGKQSVRATFRLPQQIIDLLSVIAGQLGIKQKSLFDQLVENVSLLEQVAREARNYSAGGDKRHQKTLVISRSSLLSLNKTAQERQIQRDILVEVYIKQLLPVIKTELEKHRRRKILLKEMKEYKQHGKTLLQRTGELLSKDDMLYGMIENQISIVTKNVAAVENIIEKGMPMEDW
jgi:hypothetical protein